MLNHVHLSVPAYNYLQRNIDRRSAGIVVSKMDHGYYVTVAAPTSFMNMNQKLDSFWHGFTKRQPVLHGAMLQRTIKRAGVEYFYKVWRMRLCHG